MQEDEEKRMRHKKDGRAISWKIRNAHSTTCYIANHTTTLAKDSDQFCAPAVCPSYELYNDHTRDVTEALHAGSYSMVYVSIRSKDTLSSESFNLTWKKLKHHDACSFLGIMYATRWLELYCSGFRCAFQWTS